MFNQYKFNTQRYNGGPIYETTGTLDIVSSFVEKESAIRNETNLDFTTVLSFLEKEFFDYQETNKEFTMLMSFTPYTERNDTLAQGVTNIKKPIQGQIQVIAE